MGKGGDATPWGGRDGSSDLEKRRQQAPPAPQRLISMEEVKQHRTPEDAWMVYKNKVYDVSGWHDHPGGHVIFTHAGDDFTDIFAAFHPPSAYEVLSPFCIGELTQESVESKPLAQRNFERGYRELRGKLVAAGMFKSSLWYYAYKCASNMAIWAAGCALIMMGDSFGVRLAGAFLLAIFWQQCGWLAHDFLHHQVFKNRFLGDMGGVFWGNMMQGFSTSWWKNKHNTHHAVPNLHESSPDAHDGDPDIDTMPVLAWSLKMASQAKDSKWGRFFVQNQAVLYFPILFIARISWLSQSLTFCFGVRVGTWEMKGTEAAVQTRAAKTLQLFERMGLILHYSWLAAVFWRVPLLQTGVLLFFAQTMCGLMLALVFGLGHNGMATYDAAERPDFWKLQVTTTRNVTPNIFVDWFCGGLQYQVDHHLFPSIPRHNLPKVHALVESFCKEHGVSYHEASMFQGTKEVLSVLGKISEEFIEHYPAM